MKKKNKGEKNQKVSNQRKKHNLKDKGQKKECLKPTNY